MFLGRKQRAQRKPTQTRLEHAQKLHINSNPGKTEPGTLECQYVQYCQSKGISEAWRRIQDMGFANRWLAVNEELCQCVYLTHTGSKEVCE